jgi:hypothetical protein
MFLDGNFEASLILLEEFWNESPVGAAAAGIVVAIPARDVLACCDLASSEGIAELYEVVRRADHGGDHLLTPHLYSHQGQAWVRYKEEKVLS